MTKKLHRYLMDAAAALVLLSAALPSLDVDIIGLAESDVARILAAATAGVILLANIVRRVTDPEPQP